VDLAQIAHRVYPVGRLDIDSEGLVLLTDDGELTFRLTHARFGIEKEYQVSVASPDYAFDERQLEELRRGVMLEDGLARAVRATLVRSAPYEAVVRVVLVEGRQREVRRMLAAVGCSIESLQRIRIGPLLLGDLKTGEHRPLRSREVDALRTA